jgi:dethiobiotin synthetase
VIGVNKNGSSNFFVTGIGTDVGKTVVSAILSEALQAYYWKPIQSGDLENSDSLKIQRWTKNVVILTEKYRLNQPFSPHTSARLDYIFIASEIELPKVDNVLIVEGAGGVLVPINDDGITIGDWMQTLAIPVIVVVKHYLGSINHTLLTLEYLKSKSIEIAGIVVTGEKHEESERIIETVTGKKINLHIPLATNVDEQFVCEQALLNREKITSWLLG